MTYALSLATLPATSIENGCVAASNEIAEPKKCTRVGDREFPDGKSPWPQLRDFGRYPP